MRFYGLNILLILSGILVLGSDTAECFPTINSFTGIRSYPKHLSLLSVVATPSVSFDGGMNPSVAVQSDENVVVLKPSSKPMSMASAIFGLVKAMLGCGLLGLSSGLAAVTDHPSGLYPAHTVLVVLAVISAYTFSLYGRLTHATQAKTLGEIWKRLHSKNHDECNGTANESSKRPGLVVSWASFVFCFGSCVAYSLALGDMCSSFVQGIALPLPSWAFSRQASILAITSTVLLPLCRLSSLASLAPASIVGVLGTVVTIAFLAFRCPAVVSGSPYRTHGVGMLSQVIQQPSFSTYAKYNSPAPLILIAMACIAFMAHFSAPDFYHALSLTSPKNETTLTSLSDDEDRTTMQRYNRMTIVGYFTVMVLNALTLTFGFLTFGGASNGMILNNYNLGDWGAIVSRMLVGMSIMGSYPFLMSGCRAAALEIFSSPEREESLKSEVAREHRMTSVLLSLATAISLLVKDVGFVLSLNGAVMGSTIAFTFPALLFLKLNEASRRSCIAIGRILRAELWLCRSLVGFGVVSAIVGGATTIIDYFFPYLLA